MIPLWIFTLGKVIFQEDNLGVPYTQIAAFVIALVIPLGIGFLIQWYLPRVSKIMVRVLKPFAALLILFIIIFAIITNFYLFEFFTWKVRYIYKYNFMLNKFITNKQTNKHSCMFWLWSVAIFREYKYVKMYIVLLYSFSTSKW
jgi:predicted Na+-dependent transporter